MSLTAFELLELLPQQTLSHAQWLNLVSQDSSLLKYAVDSGVNDRDVLSASILSDGINLKYVPKDLRTEDLCLEAVRTNGASLEYVPKDLRTEELCVEAVYSNGFAILDVPVAYQTEALIMTAVRRSNINIFSFLPDDKFSLNIYNEAKRQGYDFKLGGRDYLDEKFSVKN